MSLFVSEVFGPTFQGEGPNAGKRCGFVRLMGCNLHCWWCDTPYTWRFTDKWSHRDDIVYNPSVEGTKMSVHDIDRKLAIMEIDHIVISGGEPMLQQENLASFIHFLTPKAYTFEIETAGTILPKPEFRNTFQGQDVSFNVSPKLANSRNSKELRFKPKPLIWFAQHPRAYFKFVVQTNMDFGEVSKIIRDVRIDRRKVYIMPEGVTPEALRDSLSRIVDFTLLEKYNLSPRLQIDIWGNKRGV